MKKFTLPVLLLLLVVGLRDATAQRKKEIAYDSLSDIHYYTFIGQNYDYNRNTQEGGSHTVAIKGTAFLYNGWPKGHILLENGRKLPVYLNYNVMEDQLLVLWEGKETQVTPRRFWINKREFVQVRGQYLELIHEGKINLLKQHKARLDEVQRNGYNDAIKYDFEYAKLETLMLHTETDELIPIRLNEKNIMSKLADQQQTARAVIKEKNLNLKQLDHLVDLLQSLD
ncbi:hypothetical protein [Telluribacter sp.]|jgi:hypothetical protein|uniref:hypothetical protein n=1 Tax=Telluribacter sp. TaxID=1978767 RepID=UPI002E0F91CB|nr:hypothetical protein [Telluribacter sp.]